MSAAAKTILRALSFVIIIGATCLYGSSAEITRRFDISTGNANRTLKQFAQQADLGIVYNAKEVKGLRTNAVNGEFHPRAALEQMLENTQLKFIQDNETGAIAVTRSATTPSPNIHSPRTPTTSTQQTDMNMKNGYTQVDQNENADKPEKTKVVRNVFKGLLSFAILGAASEGVAQSDDDVYELDAFEVFSSTQKSSLKKKQDSNIIGSFLSGDALSELPDDDLGEALSRLAGVNVVGGQGNAEGEVTIRGAEGRYNSIRINGASQANARLDTRNFDVTQIPSEMVAGVEIIKSITAEHPADSIGGSVNVETANAFDMGSLTRYKLERRYRDQGEHWGTGGNIVHSTVVNAFGGENNFGILLNLNYVEEELVTWATQNRFLLNAGRIDDDDPNYQSFIQQTVLEENPDAAVPIWNRFDPNETRTEKEQLT
ncbi:MAG: TonB-dependent receptor plug domain-containing protein, partial [Verrucomicrobiota bacterium]